MIFGQQQQFWQPEVRRAIPVEKPTPTPKEVRKAIAVEKPVPTPQSTPPKASYPNPAWMQRVQPSPPPASTPEAEPESIPYRPQGRIEVAPKTSTPPPAAPEPSPQGENGEIRLSPSSSTGDAAADEELKVANSIYSRKMYDYAIMEYEKFLIAHPSAPGRDTAMFRLAESHRMLGNEGRRDPDTRGSCRSFARANSPAPAPTGSANTSTPKRNTIPRSSSSGLPPRSPTNDEVRISAKYNLARCLDRLKRWDEAAKFYEEVAAVQKNNPYLYYARLSLAENAAAVGRRKEALEGFSSIASSSAPAGSSSRSGCQGGRPGGGTRR